MMFKMLVSLVEETRVPGGNYRHTHRYNIIYYLHIWPVVLVRSDAELGKIALINTKSMKFTENIKVVYFNCCSLGFSWPSKDQHHFVCHHHVNRLLSYCDQLCRCASLSNGSVMFCSTLLVSSFTCFHSLFAHFLPGFFCVC